MPVDESVDNTIEKVIIARMVFSADRENFGQGEEDVDLDGILKDLRQGKCAREKREEEVEQRGNLLGDYVRGLTKKPPQHVNQEFRTALTVEAARMFEQLHAAWGEKVWEEVIHQLLRSWEDVQVYCYDHHRACPALPSILREGGAIPIELEERSPLYLQEYLHSAGWRGAFLAHRVSEDGRLPRREELVVHMAAQGMGETDVHVAWLADRHMEAKNLLILSNMRFAVYKARQCCGRGIEMDDVIQESVLGLMEAANHFEPHRGGTFIYFAARRVRAKIRAECIAQRGIVRRSPSVWTEIVALERCEGALRGTLGRTPSPEELGEALSWAVETVKRVQQASMQGAVSLDTVIGGDE
ncbi:hypothetical protein HYW11_01920, partial [Candidatus Peregrinibacteria bacterium]|nr:hypothetical protein [Candidatus Peregrinibacteria bacterium]